MEKWPAKVLNGMVNPSQVNLAADPEFFDNNPCRCRAGLGRQSFAWPAHLKFCEPQANAHPQLFHQECRRSGSSCERGLQIKVARATCLGRRLTQKGMLGLSSVLYDTTMCPRCGSSSRMPPLPRTTSEH